MMSCQVSAIEVAHLGVSPLFHDTSRVIRMLNLGCGSSFHPDWVNADLVPCHESILPCDITKRLPFDDQSFDVVYHSHVLEHLTKEDARRFLGECCRILKPGGIIRVVVPDLEQIAKTYLAQLALIDRGDHSAKLNHHWMQLELLDQMTRTYSGGEMGRYLTQTTLPNETFVIQRLGREVLSCRVSHEQKDADRSQRANPRSKKQHWRERLVRKLIRAICGKSALARWDEACFRARGEIHQWMYDRISLADRLLESGFERIRAVDYKTSRIPNWSEYGLDEFQGSARKPDSLYLEGQRR